MTLSRRRFLAISAGLVSAVTALPAGAAAIRTIWTGRAFGTDVSVTLVGIDERRAWQITRRIEAELEAVERVFSLYRPSTLTRLNATGIVVHPEAALLDVASLTTKIHEATDCAFDPTVQALWLAAAEGRDPAAALKLTGWRRIAVSCDRIVLQPGMALTFNGVAQGHAADRIASLLRGAGLDNVLVDMGEANARGIRDDGSQWMASIAGPDGREIARIPLCDRSLATSSPGAVRIGARRLPHIFHAAGHAPLWRTISVSAKSAALADALSTAFCLMPMRAITRALTHFPDARLEVAERI